MEVTRPGPDGLALIALPIHREPRGFFTERFKRSLFLEHGLPTDFVQDNHSRSEPGVLRGLHYQHCPRQGKLVGAARGRIWDVAVDIRPGSPTLGRSYGVELSDANGRLLWVPAGFAHGFCVLGNEPADVIYKTDAEYDPAGENGILWSDADLSIDWPVKAPVISERDKRLESFADYRARQIKW